MSRLKYSGLSSIGLSLCLLACKSTDQYITPFRVASPTLEWTYDSTLWTKQNQTPWVPPASDLGHVRYLTKLLGTTASAKKWSELLGKALRANGYQWHPKASLVGSQRIPVDAINVGDLIYFHERRRCPQRAIISKVIHRGRFLGVAPVNGKIVEIRIDLHAPNRRRIQKRIVNSFIRTVKRTDKQHGYLAGELVREVRRPLRSTF